MPNEPEKKRLTASSFGKASDQYLNSDTHQEGDDLNQLASWCRNANKVLDIATGAGHTAGAVVNESGGNVVAVDASLSMTTTAVQKFDVEGVVADAERLPFKQDSFDAVTCRIAAHHFPNPQAFVSEVSRVLCAGGIFAFEDNVSPESGEIGDFLNKVEKLRDPTHVESYTTEKWRQWLDENGLSIEKLSHLWRTIDFESWTSTQSLSDKKHNQVEQEMANAPPKVKTFFEIQEENGSIQSFANIKVMIRAKRKQDPSEMQ